MRDHVIARLKELALKDPRIVLITGDLGFGVLNAYREECADQFINVGVAEQNMTGVAAGMALEGHVVFTYSIANFPTLRCLEQLRNDVCYHDVNVNILAVGGGFSYGSLGMSHHATEDISIMRALPNMQVIVPSDPWQAAQAVDVMVADPRPCYLRIDKSAAGLAPAPGCKFTLGKARNVRDGTDAIIISAGGIVAECVAAAENLASNNTDVGIIEMPTVKPIDRQAVIDATGRSRLIMTVEENSVIGGLGGAVAEIMAETGSAARLVRVGLEDVYSSVVGSQEYLRCYYAMDAAAIAKRITDTLAST